VVIRSFLLYQGGSIGYVWIIKVFLLIMLVTPFLLQIVRKSNLRNTYFLVIALIILEELLVRELTFFQYKYDNLIYDFLIETVPYLIGYSVFFLFGLVTKKLSEKEERYQMLVLLSVSLVMFVYWYYVNGNLMITDYKYPPQMLYITYGCIMPLILWITRRFINLSIRYEKMKSLERHFVNVLIFMGQNTLWIYLWHILFVLTANHFISYWPLRYIFVLVMATLAMTLQYIIINKIRSIKNLHILDYFVG
jgi:hypothetical protein